MEKKLKQRLLGAVVITVLAVVIVPELVRDRDDRGQTATEAPPAVVEDDQGITISLPEPEPLEVATPAPATAPSDAENSETTTALLESDSYAPLPLPDIDLVSVPRPEDTTEAKPKAAEEMPLPQDEDVREQAARERAAREQAARERAERQRAEREQAAREQAAREQAAREQAAREQAAREQAARQVQLPEIELIAQATPKPSISGAWVVQAGSFSLEENASLLRDRLRAQRFAASVQRAVVGGRTLYRVRIGPQASRADSERVRERLLRETGVTGEVVPADG